MRSSGSKPPGASTFNIEPAVTEGDSEGQVEVLEGLPLGAIYMDSDSDESGSSSAEVDDFIIPWPVEEWRDHYPFWGQPGILARREIGDCHIMMAASVLTLGQPYPGDDYYLPDHLRPEMRFILK
jgi:hypothetical protein